MKNLIITIAFVLFVILRPCAQPRAVNAQTRQADPGITSGLDMSRMEKSFVVTVNPMNDVTKAKLNKAAANYRAHNRSVLVDLGASMLNGGVTAVVTVVGNEIINLAQVRSRQKKAWREMRQKECVFVDSLESVRGQNDFYSRQSIYGPLDPSDMNFDGFTLRANKNGSEVLKLVCHIDTTRLDHLFMHSKFYLVVDSIVFHPYRSYLPNLGANRIMKPDEKTASKDEIDYWNTISQFSFDDHKSPSIGVKMDISSSWINELVQVYHDVPLGSFNLNFKVDEADLKDSVYVYSREKAIAGHLPVIDIEGDCFVVPRSYMPVSASSPSWGTGEYKMKVVLSQKCKFDPDDSRSKNWRRDYNQLVKLQNHGKSRNDYWQDITTTFRDNGNTILKATYSPLLNKATTAISSAISPGGVSAAGKTGTRTAGMNEAPSAPAQPVKK